MRYTGRILLSLLLYCFAITSQADPYIFWRHASNGLNTLWSMEGQTRLDRFPINTVADPNWQVEGMADFMGDGTDEILFRHQATGENRLWTIENGARTASIAITSAHPNWQVVAIGDFDADGDADLMWRNSTNGANRYWEMNGSSRVGSMAVTTVATSWEVVGSGDFDNDGSNDLFWRHSSGANTLWFMQSENRAARVQLPTVSADWTVGGIGDFDADGSDDVFWHNPTTGANSIWLLGASGRESRASIPGTSSTWYPVGVFDMNDDGKADILWRNSANGQNRLWLMDGSSRSQSLAINSVVDQNWTPVAVGDIKSDTVEVLRTNIDNIWEFIDICPQNDPAYDEIFRDFEIVVDGVSAENVLCTEPYTEMPDEQMSVALGYLQALRVAYYMDPGVQYLPWTTTSLHAWINTVIDGVWIEGEGGGGSCCRDQDGKTYMSSTNPTESTLSWWKSWYGLSSLLDFIAHEVRHGDGGPGHVTGCESFPNPNDPPGCDQEYDLNNLGSYGVQYWLQNAWMTSHLYIGMGCTSEDIVNQQISSHWTSTEGFRRRMVETLSPLEVPTDAVCLE